jgi:nitric oxide reductase NorQ protein
VRQETSVDAETAEALVRLATAIRRVKDAGLREVASTRTLISAAALISEGLSFLDATTAAVAGPLTDDLQLRDGLVALISAHAPLLASEAPEA